MTFDFINPLMLIGLTGLALPILAHLISKKKYDVVHWGAMQFLELGRNARRRLRLEELLLLLVRMGLVALLVIALARPWVAGGWLTRYVSKQDRDVVFVIDGSYSMGWQGEGKTPHEAAVQWARDFLEELKTGDTVALIDARDRPRAVIEFPTSDLDAVRAALDELPAPAGTANLPEAIAKAIQILARTSNLVREVIVLSDGQALSWRADDENLWLRIDDLRQQPAVLPRIWAVNVRGPTTDTPENFLVDRLQVSRELTVSGFPVRISTRVRRSGGTDSVMRTVSLEVDGQRLSEKTLTLRLPPDGAASVEFEYRFTSPGAHLVSVVMEADLLPGDDRADAAIRVAAALPALLVDGDPQPDPARMETFFAQAALTASVNDSPWIRATVLPWDQFDRDDLAGVEVVVLMNVPRLTDAQLGALKDFLNEGGGVCIALGDRIEARRYRTRILAPGDGLLPAELIDTVADTD
ncbi:MAG TPA: VWA domain-containing protein, partial [Planctomycetes bacterium]|nr:VWA domain-containing protein [Planctomycetota bacterium]